MANAFWNFVLNKGWAGESLSRQETIERLNPLLRQLVELNHGYNYVADNHGDENVSSELASHCKTGRSDVVKLRETVLSSGGVPYSGVDFEPEDMDLGRDRTQMLSRLQEMEQAFLNNVETELDLDGREHHMRTKAVLGNLRTHSQDRLAFIQNVASTSAEAQPDEA